MRVLTQILRSNFLIKLRSWEYWPFGIIQAPAFFYWLWYALKTRSLFFFSASNPSILMGGMFGESKFEVLELVPNKYKPETIRIRAGSSVADIRTALDQSKLNYPVIFKPDLGERGWFVRKISNEEQATAYLNELRSDFIIQEFVALPLEFGVFYVRHPDQPSGQVTSITQKEMLTIKGDGKKNIQQLILEIDRAKLQWKTLKEKFKDRLMEVPPEGLLIELVSIGNHCLGTKFLNGNHLITDQLSASFDAISRQIKGFYFGRYDLRAASVADLQLGNVKILELNGCGAEPSHIYQPGASLWEAVRVIIRHWKTIYRISHANHLKGVPYVSFQEGKKIYQRFKSTTKNRPWP